MKSTFIYIPIILALAASNAYAESTVAASGAWTDTATWLDSTVPTATSSSPLDVLKFNSDSLNLSVGSDVYVKTISYADKANNTITIGSGSTFTLKSSGVNDAALIQSSLTTKPKFTFAGEGTLAIALTTNAKFYRGSYVFNSQVKTSGSSIYFSECEATINNTWNGASEIAVWTGVTLNINADFKSNRFNAWGNTAKVNLADGIKMTVNGPFAMTNGSINGTLTSSGATSENYNMSFGRSWDNTIATISWGANAKINSTSTSYWTQIRNCKLTINSGVNSFTNKSDLLLNNVTITMNSSNVFNVKEAGSQDLSKFIIARRDKGDTSFLASTATFIFNADNSFGEFSFFGDSKLNITDNGHQIFINTLSQYDDASSVTLVLNNLTDFCVKIGSLNAIDTYVDGEGAVRASNITYSDSEGFTDDVYIVEDVANGGYWLNSSVVPEPATVASILGALAIGYTLMRRRRA